MNVIPAAVILINADLVDSVRAYIVKQLHIDEAITGTEFDARVAANPNYVNLIKQLELRILVERTFKELTNRDQFDLVVFLKNGIISCELNRLGPPGISFPLKNLYWGQFGVF
jgi:hypothetical protein